LPCLSKQQEKHHPTTLPTSSANPGIWRYQSLYIQSSPLTPFFQGFKVLPELRHDLNSLGIQQPATSQMAKTQSSSQPFEFIQAT
jgi:hypothetical protein